MTRTNTYLNAPTIIIRTLRANLGELGLTGLEKAYIYHAFEGKAPDVVLEFTAKMVDGRIKGITSVRVLQS